MTDSGRCFRVAESEWAYRRIITFAGYPFVLFEKEALVQPTNVFGDQQIEGSHKISSGDIKLEPLDEVLSDENCRDIVERVNTERFE